MSKLSKKRNIVVYTDGSCAGNGKDKAVGGIGIYFPEKELKNVSKIFRIGICTNQRAELWAILMAIRYIEKNFGLEKIKINIKTDSQYCIDCITKWVYGWIKNGWRTKNDTPVANQEFIEKIHEYYENYNITLEHVVAHTGGNDDDSIFNDKADKLATKATERAISQQANNTKNNTKINPKKYNTSNYVSRITKNNTNFGSRPNFNNIEVELISAPKKTTKKTTKKTSKPYRSRHSGSKTSNKKNANKYGNKNKSSRH